MQEVAEGIHRLGAKLVNWYIIVDGGKLTIVDAGNPNQYGCREPSTRTAPRLLSRLIIFMESKRQPCSQATVTRGSVASPARLSKHKRLAPLRLAPLADRLAIRLTTVRFAR
jgi:hypothetical protein